MLGREVREPVPVQPRNQIRVGQERVGKLKLLHVLEPAVGHAQRPGRSTGTRYSSAEAELENPRRSPENEIGGVPLIKTPTGNP